MPHVQYFKGMSIYMWQGDGLKNYKYEVKLRLQTLKMSLTK